MFYVVRKRRYVVCSRFLLIISLLLSGYFVRGQEVKHGFDFFNIESSYNYGTLHQVDVGFSLTKNFGASIFQNIFYYGPSVNLGYGYSIDKDAHLFHSGLGYEYCGFLMIFIGRVT